MVIIYRFVENSILHPFLYVMLLDYTLLPDFYEEIWPLGDILEFLLN